MLVHWQDGCTELSRKHMKKVSVAHLFCIWNIKVGLLTLGNVE